jgi:hypothetical protein
MDLLEKLELFSWDGEYKVEVNEESEWQAHIKKMLKGRNLGDMDDEETKAFFKEAKASYKGGSTDEGELPPALKKAIDKKNKKDGKGDDDDDDEEEGESKEHEDSESDEEEKEEHKKGAKKDKADK